MDDIVPLYDGCSCTPLFEVFSVTFQKNNNNQQLLFSDGTTLTFEVYGFIRVVDWKGNQWYLYCRDDTNPETILFKQDDDNNNTTLPLTIEDVIVPSSAVCIEVSLRDNIRDLEIVSGVVDLKSVHDDVNNNLLHNFSSSRIEGVFGTLLLLYNAYQHAIMGKFSVQFGGELVMTDLGDIHGTIVAHCHMACSHRCDFPLSYANSNELSRIVLFDKPPTQTVKAEYEVPIELTRSVMAYPIHASIIVDVDLWKADQCIGRGSVGFMNLCPFNRYGQPVFTPNGYITVRYRTDHAYLQSGISEPVIKELPPRIPNRILSKLHRQMEVYSVVLHRCKPHKTSIIYGSISVHDDLSSCISYKKDKGCIIYNRDKSCAQQLKFGNEIGPLTGSNCSIRLGTLRVDLILRDEDDELVCCGTFDGNFFDKVGYSSWCGMPLCCLAEGDIGYAAVYYAVFSSAVTANIRVKFFANTPANDVPVNVSGGLVARYSNFNSSVFQFEEERYYQSKIYVKDPTDVLLSNAEIILTKSVVVVALDASIIIDLNLKVSVVGKNSSSTVDDEVQGTVEFKTDVSGSMSSKEVQGRDYHAKVYVEWSE